MLDERNLARLSYENEEKLKGSHSLLISTVIEKLEQKNIAFSKFERFTRIRFLNIIDLKHSSSIKDILTALSGTAALTAYSCGAIEVICNEFGKGDQELAKMLKNYKVELAGYYATTKIIKWMKKHSNYDEEIYEMAYCKTLRVKLRVQVSQKCLDYIEELWSSIETYLYLPQLPALLISICEGCIEVAWLIPTKVAREIQEKAGSLVKVAQEFPLITVKLDGQILYPNSSASVSSYDIID